MCKMHFWMGWNQKWLALVVAVILKGGYTFDVSVEIAYAYWYPFLILDNILIFSTEHKE